MEKDVTELKRELVSGRNQKEKSVVKSSARV